MRTAPVSVLVEAQLRLRIRQSRPEAREHRLLATRPLPQRGILGHQRGILGHQRGILDHQLLGHGFAFAVQLPEPGHQLGVCLHLLGLRRTSQFGVPLPVPELGHQLDLCLQLLSLHLLKLRFDLRLGLSV